MTAELIADRTALVPGATTTVALRFAIAPGWHTYWRNPGESGLPTTLAWKLPPGFAAGDIVWPAPRALPAGPLVNYGYEGDVLHLVPVSVPSDAQPGSTATLAARADWLVCKETCIPEGADLTLALPVAAQADPDPRWHAPIAATRDALPQPAPGSWEVQAVASGSTVKLSFAPGAADPGRVWFFAENAGRIEPSVMQAVARRGGRVELALPVAHDVAAGFTDLRGVLTAERGFAVDGRAVRAIALDVALQGTPMAGPKPAVAAVDFSQAPASAATALSLPIALAFAFAGGLLLNLMPCVFPVLSLKALGLATPACATRSRAAA